MQICGRAVHRQYQITSKQKQSSVSQLYRYRFQKLCDVVQIKCHIVYRMILIYIFIRLAQLPIATLVTELKQLDEPRFTNSNLCDRVSAF